MAKHPKDRAERLEQKKKTEAKKLPLRKDKKIIKSFQELIEHMNKGIDDEDDNG